MAHPRQTSADSAATPETADVHTASDNYASRFSGPTGEWMLKEQERILLGLLRDKTGAKILDVGGGHAQVALPLSASGFAVTVIGSSPEALHQLERTGALLSSTTGDLLSLPFPDRSFDTVVCFRLLPHCNRWPELIAELCRVAAKSVVVDYPTGQSINSLTPMFFGIKKNFEKNTRPYRLFAHRQVADAFGRTGFSSTSRIAEFFAPMVLHRFLRRPRISQALELPCRLCGLTAILGSPVIARFDRKD